MKQATDVMRQVNVVAYCVLAVACVRQWHRHKTPQVRWAAIAFGSLATISVIGLALERAALPDLAEWLIKGLLVVLILFPYFLYRFATAFERSRASVTVLAHVVTATVVLWSLALPSLPLPGAPEPVWWTGYRVAVVVQWTVLFAVVATRLWVAGRGEATGPRRRMRTLALATVGMNLAVLLSGVAPAPQSEQLVLVTQVLSFGSSVLFFIGLAPPSWLLHLWRRHEETTFRLALGDLFRSETADQLNEVLLGAVGLVGARGAALISSSGQILGIHGQICEEQLIEQIAETPAPRPADVHRVALRAGSLLLWTSPYAPYFGRGELALTEALGVFADIVLERCTFADEQRRFQAELLHQAQHDVLTDLPNRSLLTDRLQQAVARLERHSGAVTVQFLDLDRFKVVNDGMDHAAGDALLVAVAQRLAAAVRAEDTVARFGGDEFVVVSEVSGEREALALARRLMKALAGPFRIAGRDISVTASVGVVVATEPREPGALLRDADAAMYRAKDLGRGRIELFDEQTRTRAVERLEMERALHRGLREGEFRLYYQPTVRLSDGAVVGVEALLRWQHPELGLLTPAAFIPLAEDSELIVSLGEWVLQEACQQAAAWRAAVPLDEFVMWVNVSGAQFARMDVPGAVAAALASTGLDASSLGLEITESVFMGDTAHLHRAFDALSDLGVVIAIDDFGTGFSSLSSLKRFPADVLKIDGYFIQGLGHDPEDAAIVETCVALADALGLAVVAEQVETAEQRVILAAMGCEYGQGYYFCKPLLGPSAEAYLRQHGSAAGPAMAVADPKRSGRPPLALVCDDEASVRHMYRLALESEGAEVVEALDAASGVEWAVEHQPDLALVDLRMPGKDGLWTIAELHRRCPDTRLVLMSADPDHDRFRRGMNLGADECLAKDDVLARLSQLVADAAVPDAGHDSSTAV
jgi:diguanylate cyclase (GGDEF)-like protein